MLASYLTQTNLPQYKIQYTYKITDLSNQNRFIVKHDQVKIN